MGICAWMCNFIPMAGCPWQFSDNHCWCWTMDIGIDTEIEVAEALSMAWLASSHHKAKLRGNSETAHGWCHSDLSLCINLYSFMVPQSLLNLCKFSVYKQDIAQKIAIMESMAADHCHSSLCSYALVVIVISVIPESLRLDNMSQWKTDKTIIYVCRI